MEAIASSPKHIFTVTDYTSLKALREKLAKSTCLGKVMMLLLKFTAHKIYF